MARGYYSSYSRSYSQPSAEQLKQKIQNTINEAIKKGKPLEPIEITGRKIAKNWWGEAWCENLESYADYENRIDRGKRYVRNGSVVDLKINKGIVKALVQGTRKKPYKVEIRISPITSRRIDDAIEKCGSKIQNIEALITGNFPKEYKEIFLEKGSLFPTPNEISFSCSCPDLAIMCKHVAASLYAIGAKFDSNPLLFFELRGIDINRFIDIAVSNRIDAMLENATLPSSRIIENDDLASIFGDLYSPLDD